MSQRKMVATVVSHTHWDREWYLPFQVFRVRLVQAVNQLIHILQTDPSFKSFMLDGQTVLIEDYLEIEKDKESLFKHLVESGRIAVGPWYVLADEFLVSPEALIRNLLMGLRVARRLGKPMLQGYVPDSFGHIAQLPQILKGFGIDSVILWRGLGEDVQRLGTEFWWEAPDGSQVLAIFLLDGYSNASNLGYPATWDKLADMEFDMKLAVKHIQEAIQRLLPYARSDALLLMNGSDHSRPEPRLPQILERARRELEVVEIRQGTLEQHVGEVLATSHELETYLGEMRWGRYAPILQGVHSTRVYLKQANQDCEIFLERYVEPLTALCDFLELSHYKELVQAAWKMLLKNHPHDDICGCSIDEVHEEMMQRYREVDQLGRTIVRDAFDKLCSVIEYGNTDGFPVVFFNPLGWPRGAVMRVAIPFPAQTDAKDQDLKDFVVVDGDNKRVPFEILSWSEKFWMEVGQKNRTLEADLHIDVQDIPSCGFKTLYVRPLNNELNLGESNNAEQKERVSADPGGQMENEYLIVRIRDNGSFDLVDKERNVSYRNLHTFEDTEDIGDEYTFYCRPDAEILTTQLLKAKAKLLWHNSLSAAFQVELNWQIPSQFDRKVGARSSDLRTLEIVSLIELRGGSKRVDITTTVVNSARDHRLRVVFDSGIVSDYAVAGGHFDIIRRPLKLPEAQGWSELPVQTSPHRLYFGVDNGHAGLAILSKGLFEHQVQKGDGGCRLALTLLRCVGWLSRDDIAWRPGHAGPPCQTPGAQCLGRHTFEYSVMPHGGDWSEIEHLAHEYVTPCEVFSADPSLLHQHREPPLVGGSLLPQKIPDSFGLVSLSPPQLVLSTIKMAEDSDDLIIRLYNPTSSDLRGEVQFHLPFRAAELVNLDEKRIKPLNVSSPIIPVELKAKEILTFKMVR